MTAGKEIDGGAPGAMPRTEGADDGVKSSDKKAADASQAPLSQKEKEAAAKKGPKGTNPMTPAQYEF